MKTSRVNERNKQRNGEIIPDIQELINTYRNEPILNYRNSEITQELKTELNRQRRRDRHQ